MRVKKESFSGISVCVANVEDSESDSDCSFGYIEKRGCSRVRRRKVVRRIWQRILTFWLKDMKKEKDILALKTAIH